MTTQPDQQAAETVTVTRVDWAPVPRVNLLPQEILDARGFRRVQLRLALAVVVTIMLAVAGVAWAQTQVNGARSALDLTAARTATLQQQEARYAEVPKLTTAVASAKAAREQALGQDLLWYRLMNDIALVTPANVSLTTMDVSLNSTPGGTAGPMGSAGSAELSGQAGLAGPAGQAAGGLDPLLPVGIGKLTVTGTAAGYPDVAAWLDAIGRVHGLDGSTLQTVTREAVAGTGGQLKFTSSIVVVSSALSHRYDRKAG